MGRGKSAEGRNRTGDTMIFSHGFFSAEPQAQPSLRAIPPPQPAVVGPRTSWRQLAQRNPTNPSGENQVSVSRVDTGSAAPFGKKNLAFNAVERFVEIHVIRLIEQRRLTLGPGKLAA